MGTAPMVFGEPDEPLPGPPTLAEVRSAFPVPLATLVPQPAIRETGVSTMASGMNGAPAQLETAAISYAVLRNPDDLDDPANLVELPPELAAAIADPSPTLPAAAVEWMRWQRFPSAYDAVCTRMQRGLDATLAEQLALRMQNVIGNSFRDERHPTPWEPDTFVRPPDAHDARSASVTVDGAAVPGITIDDEHAVGYGVDLGDAIALVVWPKHLLPLVRLELTRATPA